MAGRKRKATEDQKAEAALKDDSADGQQEEQPQRPAAGEARRRDMAKIARRWVSYFIVYYFTSGLIIFISEIFCHLCSHNPFSYVFPDVLLTLQLGRLGAVMPQTTIKASTQEAIQPVD